MRQQPSKILQNIFNISEEAAWKYRNNSIINIYHVGYEREMREKKESKKSSAC